MMSVNEILEQTTSIFRNVLENDSINLFPETTADDIEEWDSFTHIQLITSVEKHFKIRFTLQEISSFRNVGDMCEDLHKKMK